jgi:hypothetical protein
MALKIMQQPWLWKRFTTNAIDSYVGTADEIVLDLRYGSPVLRVMDGVTAGGVVVETVLNPGVRTPEIISPANGAVNLVLNPMITANAFFGLKGDLTADTHASSQWQVATDNGFTNVVYDSGADSTDKTTIDLTGKFTLDGLTTYYARVRYFGQSGEASSYSPTISFTTGDFIPNNTENDILQISGTPAWTRFGSSVDLSLDGSTLVVGNYDGSAATSNFNEGISVYRKTSGIFGELVRIPSNDPNSNLATLIGRISNDGNTVLAVSGKSNGYALYTLNGAVPTLVTSEATSGSSLLSSYGAQHGDLSGDGQVFARGDYLSNTAKVMAAVNSWNPIALTPSESVTGSSYGFSVAVSDDGSTIAVGAPDHSNVGVVFVFVRSGNAWVQQAKITVGLTNIWSGYGLGLTISGDGNTIAVSNQDNRNQIYEVYIHRRSGSTWSQQTKITTFNKTQSGLQFGYAMKLTYDGDTLAVSAPSGRIVSIFRYLVGVWTEASTLTPAVPDFNEQFGSSISISGDGTTVAVGAPNAGPTYSGRVLTFSNN